MNLFKKISWFFIAFSFALNAMAAGACDQYTNNDTKVLAWAYEAMLATYTYNFITYKKETGSNYYTKEVWDNYQKDFTASGTLDKVMQNKLIVSVGTEDSPLLLKKGLNKWKVQIPLLIHYHSNDSSEIQKKVVTLIIDNTNSAPECLKIENMEQISR